MGWKRLEDEDSERGIRAAIITGGTMAVVGLVGAIVCLAIGRVDRLSYSLTTLVLGAIVLVPGLWQRHRRKDR
jgi:hypothetical protein